MVPTDARREMPACWLGRVARYHRSDRGPGSMGWRFRTGGSSKSLRRAVGEALPSRDPGHTTELTLLGAPMIRSCLLGSDILGRMFVPKNPSAATLLQDRDFKVLVGLFQSRVMTGAHIAAIYFDGKKEAAKKRLQKMKAAGLIGERKRRVNEPSVLSLTRKSYALLDGQGLLSGFPRLSPTVFEKRANVSELTLRHELEIMDVKAAFHSALKTSAVFTIAEFSTWPRLHEFKATRPGQLGNEVLVRPDGLIRIHEKEKDGGVSEHTFFLEVDRSTETQDTLVNRAGCYLDYYKSGGFAVRNGALRSAYKEFPFRVLTVLKNAERRNNTADGLLQSNPPILTLVHLSTFAEVIADPLGAVWIRPIDYREAVKSTAYEKRAATSIYRRQADRELWIENTVVKLSLFQDN